MYVTPNFKTKKELKAAVETGAEVMAYSPGPFSCPTDGKVSVEGPHYPAAHSWHAEVEVAGGYVTKVVG